MAVFTPRETELLKSFLLAMKEFKKFPKLAYTGVRTKAGKIKVVYKNFALQFIRWRFPFAQHGQYADDKKLVEHLAKDDTQTFLLRDAPQEQVESLSEKEIDEIEKASEAPAHLQSQQLAQVIGKKKIPKKIIIVRPPSKVIAGESEETAPRVTPIPEAFTKAFENEPANKLDPTIPIPDKGGTREKKESLKDYVTQPPSFHLPETPGFIKDAESNAGLIFQRTIGKRLTATAIASSVGGFVGAGLSGGHPLAIAAGAGTGALLANSDSARQAVGDLANQTLRPNSPPPRRPSRPNFLSNFRKPSRKVLWIFLGLFFVLVFTTGFSDSGSGLLAPGGPGSSTPGSGTTPGVRPGGPPVGPGGPINSCKFYRGDPNTSGFTYKSNKILGYFQEASNISGIPTALLAAVARVESGSVVTRTDAQIDELSTIAKCPRSETGALGVMQIQPPGTTGHFSQGVEQGAKFLGTTLSNLTESDFCDVRKSIILSAGFILKKLQLGYRIGTGERWDPAWTNDRSVITKVAEGYYGCLIYGGPDPRKCIGPHNYGNDLWKSISECKPTTTPTTPIPPGPVPTEKLAKILYWARIINGNLQSGLPPSSFNKMIASITNGTYTATTRTAQTRTGGASVGPNGIYWCTNLVIDAYNLSGITGLGPGHQAVSSMKSFWQSTSGYTYIPFNGEASLRLAQPGYALFRISPITADENHVSIIESLSLDAHGNGSIHTLDSNSFKNWSSQIVNGRILKDRTDWPIVGFGGVL